MSYLLQMKIDTYGQKSILLSYLCSKLYCLIISVSIPKNIWFYNKLSCKNCVYIPTHLQAFINVLSTRLQELYKITAYFTTCFNLCNTFVTGTACWQMVRFSCADFNTVIDFEQNQNHTGNQQYVFWTSLSFTSIIYNTSFDDTKPGHLTF